MAALSAKELQTYFDQAFNSAEELFQLTKQIDLLDLSDRHKLFIKYLLVQRSLPGHQALSDWSSRDFDIEKEIQNVFSTPTRKTALLSAKVRLIGEGQTLIDASHTAHFPFTSGVQRVVRKLAHYLGQKPDVVFVRFESAFNAFVQINAQALQELAQPKKIGFTRKAKFKSLLIGLIPMSALPKIKYLYYHYLIFKRYAASLLLKSRTGTSSVEVLIPWGCNYLIPEVVGVHSRIQFIMPLFEFANVKLTTIFYDLIPIIHPELCSISGEFVEYLHIMKRAGKVSCISHSAQSDLMNFMHVLQGKNIGPSIKTHYLGFDLPSPTSSEEHGTKTISDVKMILCVGSLDVRKNQISLVRAAAQVTSTVPFKLVFVGNYGYGQKELTNEIDFYRKKGINIEVITGASDQEIQRLYAACDFTVFCSVAEGFGLPILESLAFKKPVITSNIGSMMEIGKVIGGCRFVDPLDVGSIASAITKMLNDPAELKQMTQQIESSKWPTWEQYANTIYDFVKLADEVPVRQTRS